MRVFYLVVVSAAIAALTWLGMMAVHEFGHVVGAWLTGGVVERVIVHPLAISRTDLSHNPRPLVVAWLGPLVGSLLPLAAFVAARWRRSSATAGCRFFAGFCLLANGAYLGIGSLDRVGDAGDLLRHGAPIGQLWAFGIVAFSVGLWLWHGLGPRLGLDGLLQLNRKATVVIVAAAAIATA